jgi:hypothetical protein
MKTGGFRGLPYRSTDDFVLEVSAARGADKIESEDNNPAIVSFPAFAGFSKNPQSFQQVPQHGRRAHAAIAQA